MSDDRKKSDLPDFERFLLERGLVSEKHAPYYVRWVIKYLSFVKNLAEETSSNEDLNVRAFLETLRLDGSVEDWQIRQADDAVKLYRMHYGGRPDRSESDNVIDVDTADKAIIDKMRRAIRVKHYSFRTEKCYLEWVERFARYLSEAKGRKLGACEASDIKDYLAYLALQQRVSSSTQNQAFNALLFLMRHVFSRDTADMSTTVRAKRGARLPVVLSVDEVRELFSFLNGKNLLIAQLLYGAGLRLMELARMRVQDVDFKMNSIVVRCGKGDKDRTTILPDAVKESLRLHMESMKRLHEQDLAAGYGAVHLPDAVSRKYPNAAKSWGWQYLFPSSKLAVDPRSGLVRRHHMSDKSIQTAIKEAVKRAKVAKHATVHTLRHSFATHLIMNGVNIREVQSLLGHKSLETTMIYTHVLRGMTSAPMSPLDAMMPGGNSP